MSWRLLSSDKSPVTAKRLAAKLLKRRHTLLSASGYFHGKPRSRRLRPNRRLLPAPDRWQRPVTRATRLSSLNASRILIMVRIASGMQESARQRRGVAKL